MSIIKNFIKRGQLEMVEDVFPVLWNIIHLDTTSDIWLNKISPGLSGAYEILSAYSYLRTRSRMKGFLKKIENRGVLAVYFIDGEGSNDFEIRYLVHNKRDLRELIINEFYEKNRIKNLIVVLLTDFIFEKAYDSEYLKEHFPEFYHKYFHRGKLLRGC